MTQNTPRQTIVGAVTCVAAILIATVAQATPTITSFGTGAQSAVSNEISGTYYVGGSGIGVTGAGRWTLTGSTLTPMNVGGSGGVGMSANGQFLIGTLPNNGTITGTSVATVNPAWSIPPAEAFTTVTLPAGNTIAARYNVATATWEPIPGIPNNAHSQSYGCFGSGDSGNVHNPLGISANGRFIVGQSYISTYNNTGTAITATSNFRFRGWVYDADTAEMRVLPTPFRLASPIQRRRDGTAWAVSDDGTVILGAQEHNVSATSTNPNPDGGRPAIWRWDEDANDYVMTYLPNGVNGSGFPYVYSMAHGTMHMNAAGTIVVGTAVSDLGSLYIAKWEWDAETETWNDPIEIGTALAVPASWLPLSVTSCGVPPSISASGMSADGNTIIGTARYSTCGSFMSGGWIWHSSDNLIKDWYDYQVSEGTPGIVEAYGPFEDNDGNPLTGLPKLGFPSGISPDGNAIVGFQGGTQLIPEATPWIVINDGGPACIAPQTVQQPNPAETFSVCDSFILSSRSAGTLPLSFQWYKDGNMLFDGPTGYGSTVNGATTYLLRIFNPTPDDIGAYHCEATGSCGTPSISAVANVVTSVPAASNDRCADAQVIGEGTNVFSWAPCGAYYNESGPSFCTPDIMADVWFSYVPSVTGEVRIETCGANFDTVIDIFDECNGFILDCNDNYLTGPSTGCASTRSRISNYPVEAGVPVLIRVAAKGTFLSTTAVGNISIVNSPAPAPNDNCENASVALPGANPLDTTEATNDMTVTCNTSQSRDVWFSYTPSEPGLLSLNTCGTSWNTVLSIHDAPCGFDLACNDNIPSPAPAGCTTAQSRILNFETVTDYTYYIRVAGNTTTAFGAGTLNLTFSRLGDLNCSGTVDGNDILHFTQALLDPTGYAADHDGSPYAPCSAVLADINQDFVVDFLDVEGFVDLLLNQ